MKKILFNAAILFSCLFCFKANAQLTGSDIYHPVVIGNIDINTPYTDTQYYDENNAFGWNDYTSSPSYSIYYAFTITDNANVTISNCASSTGTDVHLYDASGSEIQYSYGGGPLCSGWASSISTYLVAGTYYVMTEPLSSGSNCTIVTSITSDVAVVTPPPPPDGWWDLYSMIHAGNFGTCTVGTTFTDVKNNSPANGFGDQMGQPSDDIYYDLYVTSPTTINISTSGSNFNTYLHLVQYDGSLNQTALVYNGGNGPLSAGQDASIRQYLLPGHYGVIAEGAGYAYGDLHISIYSDASPGTPSGSSFANAVNAGILTPSTPFSASFTRTDCYEQDDAGGAICYYKFQINALSDVSISNCGSATTATRLKLLNVNDLPFFSADMGGPLCTGYLSSIKTALQPGTYYVATTSYDFNASTTTTISVQAATPAPTHANFTCSPLASLPSTDQNYLIEYTPRIPLTDISDINDHNVCEVNEIVQYVDGLGRPIQTVTVNGTPTGTRDVIQPVAYDQFGREVTKYLPYTTSAGNHASYRPNALAGTNGKYATSDQFRFYNTTGQDFALISSPSASTVFESSPMNRVVEQGAPGDAWQLTGTGTESGEVGHTIKIVYTLNNATTYYCKKYGVSINALTGARALIDQGSYDDNRLYVTISKDENWTSGTDHTTEEYKDKNGHVLAKRTFNGLQVLSTYYVYDDFGSLSFVLPPKAEPDAGSISAAAINNLCYQYNYDEENRLVQKRVPGQGWQYMVYNKLDQLVYSQDSVQRNNHQWNWTKYDALGRVVMTGVENNNTMTRQTVQYTYINTMNDPVWEERTTSRPEGYTARTHPMAGEENPNIVFLSINYYDDYNFPSGNPAYPYVQNTDITDMPVTKSTMTKGLLTASKVRVLGTNDMLWTVSYYDDKGRSIQSNMQHYLGGTLNTGNHDEISNGYDFTNAVTQSIRKHYASGTNTLTIASTIAYDHMGRKRQVKEQINGGTEVVLSQTDYNEVSQVLSKHLHSENDGASFLQDVTYAYNERGWLTNESSSKFTLNLAYNMGITTGAAAQFNGNIAEMYTTSDHTAATSKMKYTYDVLNRLTDADHSNGTLTENGITYDKMGNITALSRSGAGSATLSYTYSGNQLTAVTNGGSTFRTYVYDGNGNATTDGTTKGISYNMLNLPQTVTDNNTSATLATYTYTASGTKIRNTGSDGTWDYINGIVYHNSAISFIATEEGRAIPNGGSYSYQYNLKDHLGNDRVSLDKNGVLQEDEYYAFGLRNPKYDNSNNNRYLYNGKEIQTDLANQYDYGARFYDPVIARWTSVDPHAEKYESINPYSYGLDNPIRFFDIKGKDPGDVVIVFGGADWKGNQDQGGAPKIIQQLQQQYLNSKGGVGESFFSQYWGTSPDDSKSLDAATQSAYDVVLMNYNKNGEYPATGGQVIIEGYSYGGVLANHLAKRLQAAKINVSLLVTVDAAAGPENDDVDRTISSNVKTNINYFQTKASKVGSHGAKNKREKDNDKTDVVNVDVTSITNEHGKIDKVMLQNVISNILNQLNK